MRKYLAELYLPRRHGPGVDAIAARIGRAAEEISAQGTHLVLLQSIYVPADETWFCLFEVESADAVDEAMRRTGLSCERIVRAQCLPDARPATSGQR
jgi:hypothetical protein